MTEKKTIKGPLVEGAPINPMQKIGPSDAGLGQKIVPMQKPGGQSGGDKSHGSTDKPVKK